MNDIKKIIKDKYKKEFWDFKGFSKSGIHTIGKYPGTMVAEMQYELLKIISTDFKNKCVVLDPFCGSGTSLVVAQKLRLDSIGIDINPYAILLTRVKTTVYNKKALEVAIDNLFNNLNSIQNFNIHKFDNISKWFKENIILSLSKVKYCIEKEKNPEIRDFFWVCFSEVVFKFSNDRSSTFKLHSLSSEDIDKIVDNVQIFFKKIIDQKSKYLQFKKYSNSKIIHGDSTKSMEKLSEETITIICTSPPYGDNATTVTYGQFSILALKWIGEENIVSGSDLLENYSKIDKCSLGGSKRERKNTELINILNVYLDSISVQKRVKVINFFEDYYLNLIQMYRVLKKGGYLLMTVGNRRIDGLVQPLDRITMEIANSLGFEIITNFDRKIPSKKMPLRLSKIDGNKSVLSMSEETVLIFRK